MASANQPPEAQSDESGSPSPSLPPGLEAAQEPYSIFDNRQKAVIVVIVSLAGTCSSLASNIYFPALPTIAHDLNVSIGLVNLTVTSYLIFQGLAPSLWGPVSDVRGRRTTYCWTFLVFIGACVGLAKTRNYATLLVLRCLQSAGSASTVTIGSGVIGDITTRADRGGFMGIFQAGLLVPVALGPVIGGALAGSIGWRSIFLFLAIYGATFLAALIVLLPETLRSVVGNGGGMPASFMGKYPLEAYQKLTKVPWNSHAVRLPPSKKAIDVTGPFRILFSKLVAPIIFFMAISFAVWQMSITALSSFFTDRYGLNETQVGFTFIANGVGSMVGTLTTGRILNVDYRRVKASHEAKAQRGNAELGADEAQPLLMPVEKFPLEKARLRLLPVFSIIQCFSIMAFGWSIHYAPRVHIAVPIITIFVTGWTAVSTHSIIMTYMVDVFPDRSAAATASLNLARCLFAAGGASFIIPMVNGVGAGPAFTICATVQGLALSGVAVIWKSGARWRKEA